MTPKTFMEAMMPRNRRISVLALTMLAASLFVDTKASAADPASDVFLLDTACIEVRSAFKAAYDPSRLTGSGAFDANAARLEMPDGSQRFFVAYDDTGTWRTNSAITPRYAVVSLTDKGPSILKKEEWLGSAVFNKERLFMRPSITVIGGDAQSPGYFLMTGASEDNGTSGNPRTTILIYDADGEPILNAVGIATSGEKYGPRGERGIDMGAIAGRENGQQQGASSLHYVGKDATGQHVIAMAFQENNEASYVALYRVQINGRGATPEQPGATITAISDAVMLQGEARHSRPTCAMAEGTNPATFACASVHADEQPAEKGITVGRFDAKTGELLGTAIDVAVTTPKVSGQAATTEPSLVNGVLKAPTNYRYSQSVIACADTACSAYVLETSHVMKSQRPSGNNGHTPGTHSNDILLLDRDSLAVKNFVSVGNVAHTHIVPVQYGAGDGAAAVGVLSATLSGMKPAGLQVLPIDLGGAKISAADPSNKFAVSYFSNSGDVVARGLRNPQNQGRGFLFATPFVKNPGAKGGWMSGISSFTAVPMPTFGTAGDKNFMGLDLCFVPATHLPDYKKVAPGKVIRHDAARVGAPPDPLNPNAVSGEQANGGGGMAGGRERASEEASGCAMSTAHTSAGASGIGLAIAMGIFVMRRRRRASDEVAR